MLVAAGWCPGGLSVVAAAGRPPANGRRVARVGDGRSKAARKARELRETLGPLEVQRRLNELVAERVLCHRRLQKWRSQFFGAHGRLPGPDDLPAALVPLEQEFVRLGFRILELEEP